MSGCCSSSSCDTKPKTLKRECPACHQLCLDVPKKTVLQHVKAPWEHPLEAESYYFGRTEDCSVVYFSDKDETIGKSDIRTRIGIKEQDDDSLICFCFGVSRAVAATSKRVKDFVVEQTKESTCACETANPSGRCCLKDFSRFKEINY